MDEYAEVEEFRSRFQEIHTLSGQLLGAVALFGVRLVCDLPPDDAEAQYVGEQLAEISMALGELVRRLHELPGHLY